MILAKMAPTSSAPRSAERRVGSDSVVVTRLVAPVAVRWSVGDLGGGEAVEADVGEDFAGVVVDFAGGEDGGAGDGEGDDDGLEEDGADDPAGDGAGGVLLGFGGEELLIHGLVAEHEQAGGEEEFERLDGGEVAEELEVGGGQRRVDGGPAARFANGSCGPGRAARAQRVKVASRPMATSM